MRRNQWYAPLAEELSSGENCGTFPNDEAPTKLLEASWRLDVFENVKARAALESFEFFTSQVAQGHHRI